jgi:hypothetical protein
LTNRATNEKTLEKAPKITKKRKREGHIQALRNHAESSIDTKEVVKGVRAQGRWNSAAEFVASIRGSQQGYAPTPPIVVNRVMPPGCRLGEVEEGD